ncbi:MAG: sigma-54 dependent transcriptional regulator [Polyangiaceae bacterium]
MIPPARRGSDLFARRPVRPSSAPGVPAFVLEGDPETRRRVCAVLTAIGFRVESATPDETVFERVRRCEPKVVVVGASVQDELPRLLQGLHILLPHVPVVSLDGPRSSARPRTSRRPSEIDVVIGDVEEERTLEVLRELHANLASREADIPMVATSIAPEPLTESGMRGASSAMREVHRLIDEVADTSTTVLILGESGTGKELAARAVHAKSRRRGGPFVAVNCGAIPDDLVESELFGHARGSFSGAMQSRPGLFEAADGGTILLDEVGDLPLAAQVKLLRVLQDGEVRRLGVDEARRVDVRVLAATNIDLDSKVAAGTFRKDLYYRLNVFPITMPRLRDRRADIGVLAEHFAEKFSRANGRPGARLSEETYRALESHAWPGNVRELEHAIERAILLARDNVVEPWHLPFVKPIRKLRSILPESSFDLGRTSLAEETYAAAKRRVLRSFDRAYTAELLRRAAGNRSEAARRAGLDRANFRRLMKRVDE